MRSVFVYGHDVRVMILSCLDVCDPSSLTKVVCGLCRRSACLFRRPRGAFVHSRSEAAFVCCMAEFVPAAEYVAELDAFLTGTGFKVEKLPGGVLGLIRGYLMSVDVGVSMSVMKDLTPELVLVLIGDAEEHLEVTVPPFAVRVAVQWWCQRAPEVTERERELERARVTAGLAGGTRECARTGADFRLCGRGRPERSGFGDGSTDPDRGVEAAGPVH